jgi:regulation of enolase protein 1 (concanavalin A-like superfamily)
MPMIGSDRWINEPPCWERKRGEGNVTALRVQTGAQTDFWNNTFYQFKHTNGHMLAYCITGDFTLELTFSAVYKELYDQAGAMIRVNDDNWLKCGIEFTDGCRRFSAVVTRDDQSDWSIRPVSGRVDEPVRLRLSRHAESLRVEVMEDARWELVRLAFLSMDATVEAGPMCCSPVGAGLDVYFSELRWMDAIPRGLHD